jgi:hypothetical protein
MLIEDHHMDLANPLRMTGGSSDVPEVHMRQTWTLSHQSVGSGQTLSKQTLQVGLMPFLLGVMSPAVEGW